MKKIYILQLLPMLCWLLTSCIETIKIDHYVRSYALEVSDGSNTGREIVVQDDDIIFVMFRPTVFVSWATKDPKEREMYLKYARQHNDLAWNMRVHPEREIATHSSRFIFAANQVIDITLIAESDWDAETPKGSSLDDKFLILTGSPDEYINNGYQLDPNKIDAVKKKVDPRFADTINHRVDMSLHTILPIYGVLSEINFKDYKLLGFGPVWFELLPIGELQKGAVISISVKFDTGKTITYNHTCQ